ncbi:sialomucin core protein 24 isoform X1 [Syngnathoides biaculeatus]|uniref:sialomucin core protein 24 isoform X1 n=1 Tax=Syngnathoides biaculeatus TaxID=300417 RepID=UPI002ADE2FF2|nr:sialomucin core protein 24 isoform X1 [Syngnathoides biaculeatus]
MNAKMYLVSVVVAAFMCASAASDSDGCASLGCSACEANTDCQWLNCTSSSGVVGCHNVTLRDANTTCSNDSCSAAPNMSTQIPTVISQTSTATTFANTTSQTSQPITANSTNTSTPAPTAGLNGTTVATSTASTASNGSTSIAPVTHSPAPHKSSTFDAASFIGGIVLVLGLQAVLFFFYKFSKSKDRNYHTI